MMTQPQMPMQPMQAHTPQPNANAAGFTQLPQQSIFQANVTFSSMNIRYVTGQYSGIRVNPTFELADYKDPQTGRNLFAYGNVVTFDDIQKSIMERLSNSKSNGKQLTMELLQSTGMYNMTAGIPAAATMQMIASQVGKQFTATIQRDVSKDGQKHILRIMSLNVGQQQMQPMQQPTTVMVSNQVVPPQGIAQVNYMPAPVTLDMAPPLNQPIAQNNVGHHQMEQPMMQPMQQPVQQTQQTPASLPADFPF